jgi:flagellar biosynthetic protein FlhB
VIKSRIRSLQREMARKRMMSDVPKADVVITNPVHIAIAIMYKHAEMNAPVVVAKGAGVIAEKIKEIAIQHGVVIVENKPLARTIYRIVEIGEEIPSNLYKAVAEILAYVYRLRKNLNRYTGD